jgi:hypothetical protein
MMSDSEDSPSSPVAQTSEVKPPLDFAALKKLIEDAEVAAGSSDKKRKVEAVSETAKKKKIESSVIPQTVKIVTKPKVNKPLLNKKARKQLEGAQKSLDQIFATIREFYSD